jgi:signal peptidase II
LEKDLKKFVSDYVYLLGIAGIIIILDQWTKWLVRTNLAYQETWSPWPWLEPYARIVHWSNTGAVFGILPGFGGIFTILAVVVGIVILIYFPQVPKEEWPLRAAMGLQLGGAMGNLIDRITIGSVTDFISVGTFAVFNIADASISVGVAVLIIGMWIKERHKDSQKADQQPRQDTATGEANQDSLENRKSGATSWAAPEDRNGGAKAQVDRLEEFGSE